MKRLLFAVLAMVGLLAVQGAASAKVRITHPGLWMVRTEIKGPATDKTVDQEALRSTLTFCVK